MAKIQVKNPLDEFDGDEIARIIRCSIPNQLVQPHREIEPEIFTSLA